MTYGRSDLTVFLAVAFGLSWLIMLPVWIGGARLGTPVVTVTSVAMMFTPAFGVIAVWMRNRRTTGFRALARETGLTFGTSRRGTVAMVALMWLGTPLIILLVAALSAALGLLTLDLENFSLFRAGLAQAPLQGGPAPDPQVLVIAQIATAFTIAPLINSVAAFGEEWGWRGWLLPRLLRGGRGVWGAFLVSGIIWGLWHAPLTLRGYNYPELGPWAALVFVGFCVIYGSLLGWTRLRTGSVWPAVVGHGAFNAAAAMPLILGSTADPPNLTVAGIIGFVGWAVLAGLTLLVMRVWPVTSQQGGDQQGGDRGRLHQGA
ncbi:CPBP family intramembrane glutamic endopeptidase [Sinosporangium siamense]|uniref:Abortive infection protein n=1 Tax=Sinosporangium siamense TaxID=1367973 RepID=A0A919RE70_9ACTN|nr:CPBP family intramembrane glutamic endopeptidase [Sinosporangium siamense]GII90159.1 abortive infection protein [Sinosporangium siamense]